MNLGMKLNKEAEDIYVRLGIPMPYCVMTGYYNGEELYKRMLLDIIVGKYKPLNRIYLDDRYYNYSNDIESNKGNIYKIVSKNSDKIYIGSTCFSIWDRLKKHVLDYEFYNSYKEHYTSSYEVLRYGDVSIVLLESLKNVSREDLEKKECEYIHKNIDVCVNIQDPVSRKALYDNSKEKENRRLEKDRYMLKEVCKYVLENNVSISSMEDMYIVYMKIKKDIKDKLYKLENDYYIVLMEIVRLSNIVVC